MELKNKKVLQMGLGILGGGVATARFLVDHGVELTVTDMKTADYLKTSLDQLSDIKDKIKFVLGEHKEEDFLDNEIIVLNPDVSPLNPLVQTAMSAGKQIETELTLFFKYAKYKSIVGVTGTRGKTTTTNWIAHILNSTFANVKILGNDPNRPFLSEINSCTPETIAVVEMPSFQLETFGGSGFAPHVAVITNLFQDHLSRHKTMKGYALAKANIFKNQTEDDFLVLNKENEWTEFFLKQNSKSKVLFTTTNSFWSDEEILEFKNKWGEHNVQNLLLASLAASSLGVSPETIKKSVSSLPAIKFREEKIFENEKVAIYNDTAATSPEATVAAVERFVSSDKNIVLIAGGTDRELDFSKWSTDLKRYLDQVSLVLLSGSATEKMKNALGLEVYEEYDTLADCVNSATEKAKRSDKKTIILFSPGAKSFEKFKNEFDRGEQFNILIGDIK